MTNAECFESSECLLKRICFILYLVSIVGSFDDENHKGFVIALHDIWMKQPGKLATLFVDKDFICPCHEKCPLHTSQENKEPLLVCSVNPK
jgi:hypothetical protein